MILRRVPPVSSPIDLRALASGAIAALVGSDSARRAVLGWIRSAFNSRSTLLTDSGTTALILAIRAAQRIRPGPVSLPAYCCYDLATAADGAGADVLLYDLDPHTLGPDWNSFESTLRRGASAVVVAHLYGHPVDVHQAQALADSAGSILIEDAAQGVGARYDGRPLGSFGGMAILSFGRGKGLTGGGGGALLVNRDDLRAPVGEQADTLSKANAGVGQLAKSWVQWAMARPSLYAFPAALPFLGLGETIYRRPGPGSALSHASAGILRHTIGRVEEEAERRRFNAAALLSALRPDACARPFTLPGQGQPGYLRFPLLVSGTEVGAWRTEDARRRGIFSGYPRALPDLEGFGRRVRNPEERFSGARELAQGLHTLPTHSLLEEQDIAGLSTLLSSV